MRVSVDDELARGHVVVADLLFDAGDAPAGRNEEAAGIRIQPALQQGKQGGFAGSVLADDADPLAGIDDEIGLLQQHFGAAAQCQTSGADHGANCSRVSNRIWSSVFSVLSQTGSRSGNAAMK